MYKTRIAACLLALISPLLLAQSSLPPETVPQLDIQRYLGRWYEVARIPNSFQSHCVRNTIADYASMGNDRISVINRCEAEDGTIDEAEGSARIVNPKSKAQLEVSFVSLFGFNLFWGDYRVLYIDDDYRLAFVGTADREYGWILSREKRLTDQQWQMLEQIMLSKSYNRDDFILSPHSK